MSLSSCYLLSRLYSIPMPLLRITAAVTYLCPLYTWLYSNSTSLSSSFITALLLLFAGSVSYCPNVSLHMSVCCWCSPMSCYWKSIGYRHAAWWTFHILPCFCYTLLCKHCAPVIYLHSNSTCYCISVIYS